MCRKRKLDKKVQKVPSYYIKPKSKEIQGFL